MSLSHPVVRVSCDGPNCDDSVEIELTSIACNGFDLRDLDTDLESMGWRVDGEKHICEWCQEEEEAKRAEEEAEREETEEE